MHATKGIFMNWTHSPHASERLIRIAEVKEITGLSAATIYRKMAANEFPKQVSVGSMARWAFSEIQTWVAGLIADRNGVEGDAK